MFEEFGWQHLPLIFEAALVTVQICTLSILFGGLLGFGVGLMGTSPSKTLRLLSGAYVAAIRGIPILLIIFFVFFGIPMILGGTNVPPYWAAVTALSIFASAYIGEVVRGGILAVSKGQSEASDALNMTYYQKYRYVILPQAIKIMVPPGIGFLVVLVKDSSLVTVIGLVELTRSGNIVSALTADPITTYLVIGAFYFVICYALSSAGRWYERRLNVRVPLPTVVDSLTLKGVVK